MNGLLSRCLIATVTLVGLAITVVASERGPLPVGQPVANRASAPVMVAQAARPITLRLAHAITADTSRGRAADHVARRVKELGQRARCTVQVFPNAQLVSEAQALEGLQTGSIDLSVNALYSNVVKAGKALVFPFLFRDLDHFARAADAQTGANGGAECGRHRVMVLGYSDRRMIDITGSKPVNSVADLKGLKVRTPQNPTHIELFKAFGAIPVPVAWPEVYLALQQHTVDAAATALPSAYDAKHYEVTKFAATTHHILAGTAFLVSEQKWAALPKHVQQAIVDSREGGARASAAGVCEGGRGGPQAAPGEGAHDHSARHGSVPGHREEPGLAEAPHRPGPGGDRRGDTEALTRDISMGLRRPGGRGMDRAPVPSGRGFRGVPS